MQDLEARESKWVYVLLIQMADNILGIPSV